MLNDELWSKIFNKRICFMPWNDFFPLHKEGGVLLNLTKYIVKKKSEDCERFEFKIYWFIESLLLSGK